MRRKSGRSGAGRKAGALGRSLPPNCQLGRAPRPLSSLRLRPAEPALRHPRRATPGRAGRAAGAAGPSAQGSEKGSRGGSRAGAGSGNPRGGAGAVSVGSRGVGERLGAHGSFSRGTSDLSPTGNASVLARAPFPNLRERALPPGPGVGWALAPAERGRGRPGGEPRPGSLYHEPLTCFCVFTGSTE